MLLDDEVNKLIKLNLKKYDGILSDSDLKLVKELNLSNKTFSGKSKNINLDFLRFTNNLEKISIQYFDIGNNVIDILNSLNNLYSIEFSFCKFNFKNNLENKKLQSIYINCCSVKDYSKIKLTRNFTIIGENKLNLKILENKSNVENLSLNNCNINNFKYIKNFYNLKILNLDGSVFDEKNLQNLNRNIEISNLERYLPIG